MDRVLWTLSLAALLFSFRDVLRRFPQPGIWGGARLEQRAWRDFSERILTLEESLRAGWIVEEQQWRGLLVRDRGVLLPIRRALVDTVLRLRDSGARVGPTLARMRGLAAFQADELGRAQVKSSAPQAQAMGALFAVPLLAVALRVVIPEIQAVLWTWALGVFGFVAWGTVGLWITRRSCETAQWGGLPRTRRDWLHAAPLGGELFLASLQSGSPPDLAWVELIQGLRAHAPELASLLPAGLWDSSASCSSERQARGAARLDARILAGLRSVHQSVHVSLLEGKSCRERVEVALESLRQESVAAVMREVELLQTRSLLPLFFCTAPAVFGTLAWTLYWVFPQWGAL